MPKRLVPIIVIGFVALGVYGSKIGSGFFHAELSSQLSSSSSAALCTPARILYYNLQPSLYGRDGELPEFREVKATGFDITLANRNSAPVITKGIIEPYNVLWLHGGCAGEAFPLKDSELNAIRDFYLKGGSLMLDAGDNYGGGIYGPVGANCQDRANQIAMNLGLKFAGRVQYGDSTDGCRSMQDGSSPLLKGVTKIFRESSGEMQLQPSVVWGKSKPTFVGTIDSTGAPALAMIPKENNHGGVIFSPQDQGMQIRCTGKGGDIYKNIFSAFGHELNCQEPMTTEEVQDIPAASCQIVTRSLYGSGAIRVPCPTGSVIMGGGWQNGAANILDYSRPFAIGQGWECQGNKVAPDGKCVAVCCDGFIYDSVVTDKFGALNNTISPVCPQGYSVVGGGFFDRVLGKDEDIMRPETDMNGWQCFDDDSGEATGACFAVCAKRKDAGDLLSCSTQSLVAPQDKGVTVQCPKGTFVTGGGFEDKTKTNKDEDASMPSPNGDGWYCEEDGNVQAGLEANVCFARCCTLPSIVLTAPSSASRSSASSISSYLFQPPSSASASFAPSSASVGNASTAGSGIPSSEPSPMTSSLAQAIALPPPVPPSSFAPVASSTISFASIASFSSVGASSVTAAVSRMPSVQSPSSTSVQASTVSALSSAAACTLGACTEGGDAYCNGYGLRCAEIGTAPCFVCLAAVGNVQSAASSQRNNAILPTVETESDAPVVAPASSSTPMLSTSSSLHTSATRSATTSSRGSVLQAALLTPWYPAATGAQVPLGASGPGALGIMAVGAAAGLAWMRKQRK